MKVFVNVLFFLGNLAETVIGWIIKKNSFHFELEIISQNVRIKREIKG